MIYISPRWQKTIPLHPNCVRVVIKIVTPCVVIKIVTPWPWGNISNTVTGVGLPCTFFIHFYTPEWCIHTVSTINLFICHLPSLHAVSSIQMVNSKIYLATRVGKVVSVDISENPPTSKELHGHCGDIYSVLPLGSRVLPRQWLPSIIGRINVMDRFSTELSEEAVKMIQDSMIGRSVDILLTVGKGFHGLGKSNPLASASDTNDSFLLLWM